MAWQERGVLSRAQTYHQSLPPWACNQKQQVKLRPGKEMGMEEKEAAPTGPTGTALTVPEQPTHHSALSHLNQLDHKSMIPRVSNYLCSFSQLEAGITSDTPKPNCQMTNNKMQSRALKHLQNTTAFKLSWSQCSTEQHKTEMHLENATGQHPAGPESHSCPVPRTASLSRMNPGSTAKGRGFSPGHSLHNYFQLLHFSAFNWQHLKSTWFSTSVAFWKPFFKFKKGRAQKQELKHPEPQVTTEKMDAVCIIKDCKTTRWWN